MKKGMIMSLAEEVFIMKKGMIMSPADLMKGLIIGIIIGAGAMYLYLNGMLPIG